MPTFPLPTLFPGQVNGGFSSWSSWSECSKTCGVGTSTRTRKCDNPAPKNDGFHCFGPEEQSNDCLDKYCPDHGESCIFIFLIRKFHPHLSVVLLVSFSKEGQRKMVLFIQGPTL